jgi:hypothetical protein
MTRFTRVALHGSRGASIMPLTKLFSGAPHKLLAGFDRDHSTKPSRRWQPPRVISTTSLQLDHLVPTSRCNALESHSLAIGLYSCKHKWVRGLPRTPQAWTLSPKGGQPAKCPSPPLFIAPKPNRAVGAKLHFLWGHRTRRCLASDRVAEPLVTRQGGGETALGVAVTTQPTPLKTHSSGKIGRCTAVTMAVTVAVTPSA